MQVDPAEEAIDFVLHVIEPQGNDEQGVKRLELQGKNQALDQSDAAVLADGAEARFSLPDVAPGIVLDVKQGGLVGDDVLRGPIEGDDKSSRRCWAWVEEGFAASERP